MYNIAKHSFCIRNLIRNQSAERLIPFLFEGTIPEYEYEIQYVDDLVAVCKGKQIISNNTVAVFETENGGLIIAYHLNNQIFAVTQETEKKTIIYLMNEAKEEEWHHYFLPDILHLERLLLKKNRFILHSSYIATEEGAILFTAPSGGGKTTQSDLWVEHRDARIINGDKTAVGFDEDGWNAYGLPISGSSSYYLNETHPIKAIVILEKASENRLFELGVAGFSRIFSQTIMSSWDKEFCEKVMDLVIKACSEIPIYLYQCTKTSDAVEYLYEHIF